MIRHVFIWSVRSDADGDAVFDDIASLEQRVPGVRGWSIGRQAKARPHSSVGDWQYVLVADFDSQEDLDAYQEHPYHQEVLDRVLGTYENWAVVDYVP